LLHGHVAPAMSQGLRHLITVTAPLATFRRRVIPWLIWSEPDWQVWGRIRLAVAPSPSGFAPAILDLWRAGVLSAADQATRAAPALTFTRGQRFATRHPNARD
jgi:hypothetical protein